MKTISRQMLTVTAACLAVPAFSQTVVREHRLDIEEDAQKSEMSAEARNVDRKRSTDAAKGGLEEIIVTAQRRKERLQEVPISISVLGGVELDRTTEGMTEVLNRVPGVSTLIFGFYGTTQITVRGVTAAQPTLVGTSTMGYYLDSVPFGLVRSAIQPDANAYDLERIEVLRGPQGTLYGASSVNGVVRILTKDADLDNFEAKVRGSMSSTQDGGENYRGDAAVNIPIVEGKLAARAVVGYEDLSGWIDRVNAEDANDGEISNFRLKLDAKPSDKLSIGASGWLYRSEYGALNNGSRDRTNRSLLVSEPVSTDYDTFGFKVDYDAAALRLSSVSGYLDYHNHSLVDYTSVFNSPAFTGQILNTTFDSRVFSQEINLSSTFEGPWRWTAGAIYRDGQDKFWQWRAAYANPNGNRFNDSSKSFAGFATLTRQLFGGKFEVTGGLRYFEDRQVMQEVSRLSVPPGAAINPPLFRRESTFDAVSPQATLTWHPRQGLTAYASYGEGFRSGFSQISAVLAQFSGFPPVKPDNLTNYEVGAKGMLFNGLVSFDSAVYYIKWKDVQQSYGVLVNSGVGTAINIIAPINGKSASGLGFDVGVTIHPLDGLDLGLNYSQNDLSFDTDVITPTGAVVFLKGDRLAYSPGETFGASADYGFALGSGGYRGRFGASLNYILAPEARAILDTVVVVQGDNMLTTRASFSIDSPKLWTVTLYGDNLNDQKGTPYPSVISYLDQSMRIRPRTVGLQFEYKF